MSRGFVQSFIVKLLIAIIAVVFVIILGMRLLSNFINDPEDSAAARTVQILAQRIDVMRESGESVADTSYTLPHDYLLLAFPRDVAQLQYRLISGGAKGRTIERPKNCGESCLCIYRRADVEDVMSASSSVAASPLMCRSVEGVSVAGGINRYDDAVPGVLRIEFGDVVKLKPYDKESSITGTGIRCIKNTPCPDW